MIKVNCFCVIPFNPIYFTRKKFFHFLFLPFGSLSPFLFSKPFKSYIAFNIFISSFLVNLPLWLESYLFFWINFKTVIIILYTFEIKNLFFNYNAKASWSFFLTSPLSLVDMAIRNSLKSIFPLLSVSKSLKTSPLNFSTCGLGKYSFSKNKLILIDLSH